MGRFGGASQRIINRPLGTEAAKCRWGGWPRAARSEGGAATGWFACPIPAQGRHGTPRPGRSASPRARRSEWPTGFQRSSGGSAPRTSSSRRRAPFGAAPRPAGSPILSGPPACPPGTSATTRPPAARTPPTWSSAARRRRRGAALCRPALLDGAAQPLQAEAGGRVMLVDPLAPGVLRGRGADLQAGWPRRELRAGEAAARRSCATSRH